jgi:hypothetical protein
MSKCNSYIHFSVGHCIFSLNVQKMAITIAPQRSMFQIRKPSKNLCPKFFGSISWPTPFKMSSFSDPPVYQPGFLSGHNAVLVVLQVAGPHPRYGPTVRQTHGGPLKCRLFLTPLYYTCQAS